jgi:HlyD family secretion protein
MKKAAPWILLAAALGIGCAWWFGRPQPPPDRLTLYGNLDLRQVDLPFNDSERIVEVLAQEGDRVHQGQVLARLDTARLLPQAAEAEANVAAQRAVVERLHHGSRPQEIAQANANVVAAQADADNANRQWERLQALSARTDGRGISREDLDNAKAAVDVAGARLALNQKSADLTRIGPRQEDIDEAEAQLQAGEAKLAFLREQVRDAELRAPQDAVVRSRLMEPGEIATPQKPVFTMAITDPKWVRAYLAETDLPKVHPGAAATVAVDAFGSRTFAGWVGFISSVAEFTPKTVQTSELRSQLVYEIRVFVKDPDDVLRLGMPATVTLALAGP